MNKNPNPITGTFGPDVKLTSETFKDPGASQALRSVGEKMAPPGHIYKGSIAVHFFEPAIARDLAVLTQFVGHKERTSIISSISEQYALFGLSNLMLEFRKLTGQRQRASTTNKNDKR